MTISIIAAIGKNNVIGRNNSLPWKLPKDMKRFKKLTQGKPVIMGRKTFESIGKPLPSRLNIIVTHDKNYRAEGCIVAYSAEQALKYAKKYAEESEEAMVIGGAQIYKEFLPKAGRMYLTLIDKAFEGDAYFPDYNKNEWKEVRREEHKSSEYKFAFVELERVKMH